MPHAMLQAALRATLFASACLSASLAPLAGEPPAGAAPTSAPDQAPRDADARKRRAPPRDELPADYGRLQPRGLWPGEPPPWDEAKVALGRALFFDPLLSIDRSTSCASCHDPAHGFGDPLARSIGSGGATERHSPSLFNRGLARVLPGAAFSWDGRHASFEEQMLFPISSSVEMGLSIEDAVGRLADSVKYSGQFRAAFGRAPDRDALAGALAAFAERITTADARVDRFQAGDYAALSDLERTGLWIHESKGRCWRCHSGANYTDESFRATGVGVVDGRLEPGRAGATGNEADRGRFKVPTLRGVALHAPYMHDGSLASLEEVVLYYDRGGNRFEGAELEPLGLTAHERAALVAFLRALSP
ncbi:MAG: Cytochrome peroxidase precursor [Planctomycetota bacterium]|jgi:cytochrome c peroxidase